MNKFFLTITFIFSLVFVSFSQEGYEIQRTMDFYKMNKFRSGDWKTNLSENDIQGSPYLNDEFIEGTVYTVTKQKYVDLPLRYNIYNDQIEFKSPQNEIQAIATPEILEIAEFGDYTMVYGPYSDSKKVKHGFLKLEVKGVATLYSRPQIMFKKAEEPAAYKEAVPAKFVKKPANYYIKVGTAEAKRVNSKNDLPDIFPDHQNEIAAFIKKKKIKTNKPDKIKELIQFYNSL